MDPLKRRHKVFVNRAIQGRLVMRLCFYWFAYNFVLWHSMFAYYFLRITVGFTSPHPRGSLFDLYTRFAIENKALLICAVSVAPLILWDALQISHRFVGPLVRIQNVLKGLARGEKVNLVALRDGDQLTELRDALNEYLTVSGNLLSDSKPTGRATSSVDTSHEEQVLAEVKQLGDLGQAQSADAAARTAMRHG